MGFALARKRSQRESYHVFQEHSDRRLLLLGASMKREVAQGCQSCIISTAPTAGYLLSLAAGVSVGAAVRGFPLRAHQYTPMLRPGGMGWMPGLQCLQLSRQELDTSQLPAVLL